MRYERNIFVSFVVFVTVAVKFLPSSYEDPYPYLRVYLFLFLVVVFLL